MSTNQVSLKKPYYAYAQLGIPGQGADLEVWGVPVKITSEIVRLRVVSIKGAESGTDYTARFPFLVGHLMDCHREGTTLFRDMELEPCGHFLCGPTCQWDGLFSS